MGNYKHPFCNKGHELVGKNIHLKANGTRRECRICRNERQKRYIRKVRPMSKEEYEKLYPRILSTEEFAHGIYRLELETTSRIALICHKY